MYNLPYHKEHDESVINDFIEQFPFAFLTGSDSENSPVVTQVPLLLEKRQGKKVLLGHLMKNTDHHQAFLSNSQILVVFTGKHSYVSGTWYSDPYTPSTWNYMSVHLNGTIKFLSGNKLDEILQKVSLHFEHDNPHSTTVYNNLRPQLKARLKHMIVAFEIEVSNTDTVFKLSQDRDAKSYRNIINQLKKQDQDGRFIATEMEKRENMLFPED